MMDLGLEPEAPPPREMIEMETTFEKLETELKEVLTNSEALRKTYIELTELKYILQKAQDFFSEVCRYSSPRIEWLSERCFLLPTCSPPTVLQVSDGLSSSTFSDEAALIAHQETPATGKGGAMNLKYVKDLSSIPSFLFSNQLTNHIAHGIASI